MRRTPQWIWSQVSAGLKAVHDEVPWRSAAPLRNRIVHGYWSIDLSILYGTAVDTLPALVAQLEVILTELEPD